MTLVEQAIFTSVRSRRMDGYQIAASSAGVTKQESKELAKWGPAHDSVADASAAASINFHALKSGRFCVSKTSLTGAEYSGRGGRRVYTQCLLAEREALKRFANNPFRLLEAATASGHVRVFEEVPARLEPFQLVGRASPVDQSLLMMLATDLEAAATARVIEAALTHPIIGIAGFRSPARVVAGLFNLLPVECRMKFSFSTGLRFSTQRSYRLIGLPNEEPSRQQSPRQSGVFVLTFDDRPQTEGALSHGWAELVHDVLTTRQVAPFARLLRANRPGLSEGELDRLGNELKNEVFEASYSSSGSSR